MLDEAVVADGFSLVPADVEYSCVGSDVCLDYGVDCCAYVSGAVVGG